MDYLCSVEGIGVEKKSPSLSINASLFIGTNDAIRGSRGIVCPAPRMVNADGLGARWQGTRKVHRRVVRPEEFGPVRQYPRTAYVAYLHR